MRAVLLSVVILCSGCATTPQTRDDFKAMMKAHPTFALVDSYTTTRSFDDAVKALQRKWQACYNIRQTTIYREGATPTMSFQDTFHPRFRVVNKSLVEMTLQKTASLGRLDKAPPGGYFEVALDVERVSRNKAKLTWHSASWGWSKAWEANKKWSDGQDAPCVR